jgi:hypothetical protein
MIYRLRSFIGGSSQAGASCHQFREKTAYFSEENANLDKIKKLIRSFESIFLGK